MVKMQKYYLVGLCLGTVLLLCCNILQNCGNYKYKYTENITFIYYV